MNKLSEWANTWQLKFNVTKCTVIRSTRPSTPFTPVHILNNCTLNVSDQHTYLGVIIHKSLCWSPHISDIITKASRTLNFLKRNLSKCSSRVKEATYLTMVRPQLEYTSDVWDPHYVGDIMELEKVQQRAARWVLNDYGRSSSVSSMLNQLSWPTLQSRRKLSRLHIVQSILSSTISVNSSVLFISTYHPLHYILPCSSTTAHQNSYFSRTISDWNKLPTHLIEVTDSDTFKTELQSLYN